MSIDVYPESVLNAQLWNGQSMPLSIAGGGTGATTAALARTNLGLGTMATQNANAVAITGGNITGLTSFTVTGTGNSYFSGPLQITPPANQNAIVVQNPPAGTAVAFYGLVSAGTDRYNFYAPGTAPNYFAGDVGISTAPRVNNRLVIAYLKASTNGIQLQQTDNDTGSGPAIAFTNVAGNVAGTIITTATATAYNTSSDARLKHAVTTLTDALTRVRALRPVIFRWNSTDELSEGLLAHELQQVIPAAVTGDQDELNEDGSIKPQQVDYSKLVPWLVGAIQELATRLERLEEVFT